LQPLKKQWFHLLSCQIVEFIDLRVEKTFLKINKILFGGLIISCTFADLKQGNVLENV